MFTVALPKKPCSALVLSFLLAGGCTRGDGLPPGLPVDSERDLADGVIDLAVDRSRDLASPPDLRPADLLPAPVLEGLAVSRGALTPAFSPTIVEYAVAVGL